MIEKERHQCQIEELQAILDNQDTAYDYEKAFDEKWQEVTKEVFQSSLGAIPSNKNKKNDRH